MTEDKDYEQLIKLMVDEKVKKLERMFALATILISCLLLLGTILIMVLRTMLI